MVRVAIVGFGKMGVLHGALLSVAGARLSAVVERKGLLVRGLRRSLGGRGVRVARDLRGVGEVDAVYVLTPVPTHYSIVKEVLGLDGLKGVFVEKTLTDSYGRSRELCERAEGLVTAVGYQRRFSVTFRHALKLIRDGVIGEVEGFTGYAYSSDLLGLRGEDAFKALRARGGVVRDLGSHLIDLVSWLLKASIRVLRARRVGEGPCSEVAVVVRAGDALGNLRFSLCREGFRVPEVGLTLRGSRGSLAVSDDEVVLEVGGERRVWYRPSLGDSVTYLLGGPEFMREDEEFLRAVEAGRDFTGADFAEAAEVDRVIEGIEGALTRSC